MQPRIEMKIRDEVVLQIMCKPDLPDGNLAVMLEDAAMDLRWNVMRDTESRYIRPKEALTTAVN